MSSITADPRKPTDICTDVIVVGNGPSAICLSYFLSGYRPYYNGTPHSNFYLADKLQKLDKSSSIVDQELDYWCEGVEGRSSNPVAVLFDALCHPDADLGADNPSVLNWKQEQEHAISHVVLGKLRPGGAWQQMEGSMQTLSLSNWMELPDMPFQEWLNSHRRSEDCIEPCMNRATISDVCDYYTDFVQEKGLRQNFRDFHTVTSIQKVYKTHRHIDNESGEAMPCCQNMRRHAFYWEVRGFRVVYTDHDIEIGEEPKREEFCITAPNVVIATGTFDIPNKLGIAGENLPYVSHSLHEFETVINNEDLSSNSDPVLIVGAGLSAADAILMALQNEIPVIHVFRREANDSSLVLRKLPQTMYPEYHRVHSLMAGTAMDPLYRPYPVHEVEELKEDKKALLKAGHNVQVGEIDSFDISHAAILIGALPDLSFIPQEGRDLGVVRKYPIQSKHNPIDIDPYSYQSVHEPGLYAMGPLVGDNFVRFAIGGALGITNHLLQKVHL